MLDPEVNLNASRSVLKEKQSSGTLSDRAPPLAGWGKRVLKGCPSGEV